MGSRPQLRLSAQSHRSFRSVSFGITRLQPEGRLPAAGWSQPFYSSASNIPTERICDVVAFLFLQHLLTSNQITNQLMMNAHNYTEQMGKPFKFFHLGSSNFEI